MTKIKEILFALFLLQIFQISDAKELTILGATGSAPHPYNKASVLAFAFDGDATPNRGAECYISVAGGSATFDLEEKSKVESISIFTRDHPWAYRSTNNLKLEVCDTDTLECKDCGVAAGAQKGAWLDVTCDEPLEGNAVKASHDSLAVNICEIKVNGVPPPTLPPTPPTLPPTTPELPPTPPPTTNLVTHADPIFTTEELPPVDPIPTTPELPPAPATTEEATTVAETTMAELGDMTSTLAPLEDDGTGDVEDIIKGGNKGGKKEDKKKNKNSKKKNNKKKNNKKKNKNKNKNKKKGGLIKGIANAIFKPKKN